ncbi:MAG: hypothetical protein P8101_04915 [Candidatus Thiodiazotropha sp.]|jgi:hypothetical protein
MSNNPDLLAKTFGLEPKRSHTKSGHAHQPHSHASTHVCKGNCPNCPNRHAKKTQD